MVKAFAVNHTTNGDVNIVRSTVGFAKVNTWLINILTWKQIRQESINDI